MHQLYGQPGAGILSEIKMASIRWTGHLQMIIEERMPKEYTRWNKEDKGKCDWTVSVSDTVQKGMGGKMFER